MTTEEIATSRIAICTKAMEMSASDPAIKDYYVGALVDAATGVAFGWAPMFRLSGKYVYYDCDMIQEEYVTLETAKLLKAAGFPQGGIMQSYKYSPTYFEGFTEYEWCTKPTQAQAMRWLREKKGIYVEICLTIPDKGEIPLYWVALTQTATAKDMIGGIHKIPTYESAAESGIQAACKYLIEKGGKK